LLVEWTEKSEREGWLQPQGIIAVFPCQSFGNEVIVYDIDDTTKELCRFDFDVVVGSGKEDTICSAQYFYPVNSGRFDAIGVQISNTGPQIDEQLRKFKEAGDSESALFLQGLSDRLAEDMAEYLHGVLRNRLGYSGQKIGTRWSPGYPAITSMENNKRIHALLDAKNRIGVSITEAGEFFPTGCTAALVSFHPDARYT